MTGTQADKSLTAEEVLQSEMSQITARRCQNFRPTSAWPTREELDACQTEAEQVVAAALNPEIRKYETASLPLPRDEEITDSVHKVVSASLSQIASEALLDFVIGKAEAYKPEKWKEQERQERSLVGLAFSGGGIRSATFSLGVLQGLAELGLLKRFDYLSTVSGGGYIGSWFATWLKREGSLEKVEQQLKPDRYEQTPQNASGTTSAISAEEPSTIHHLREYSNYLTPRLGILSADSWTLFAIYLRNLFLNQTVLLPLSMCLVLLTRCLVVFYDFPSRTKLSDAISIANIIGIIFVLLLAWAFGWISASFLGLYKENKQRKYADENELGAAGIQLNILVPLIVAAVFLCWLFAPHGEQMRFTMVGLLQEKPSWPECPIYVMVFGVVHGLFQLPGCVKRIRSAQRGLGAMEHTRKQAEIREQLKVALWSVFASIGAGAVGGALLFAFIRLVLWSPTQQPYWIATFGPPLALMLLFVTIITEVGLMGTYALEDEREWWARLGGWLLIYATCWAAVVGLSLYGPLLLQRVGTWTQVALATGWLTTAIGGVLAGRSSQSKEGRDNVFLKCLCIIAPPVFLAGLICAVSLLVSKLIDEPSLERSQRSEPGRLEPGIPATHRTVTTTYEETSSDRGTQTVTTQEFRDETTSVESWVLIKSLYWDGVKHADVTKLLAWTIGTFVFAIGAALCVDVNVFSLHALYANRLIRCYLGASRDKRHANPFTKFDPRDDLRLHELQIGKRVVDVNSADRRAAEMTEGQRYWGPYLLINTALNLVSGDALAWQERKAESFMLSPLFCGSKSTDYRPLPNYADNLRLGRAVAISGAAASPNMGYHTSPAVAALLTVFNVRMGGWLPNPKQANWEKSGPTFGYLFLLAELFSLTNTRRDHVYLSDGGHFENLGVYELVRRRCRLIVLCDASADPGLDFDDLGSMVRKCRVDFGVDIEISTDDLRRSQGSRFSRWHCAVGTIRYDYTDAAAPVGTLIYLKPSLTGDEPADIRQYADRHSSFPQQPTSDQFFSESQFEAYRAIGYHIAKEVFAETVSTISDFEVDKWKEWQEKLSNLGKQFCEKITPKLEAEAIECVKETLKARRPLEATLLHLTPLRQRANAIQEIEDAIRRAIVQAAKSTVEEVLGEEVKQAIQNAEDAQKNFTRRFTNELRRRWHAAPPGLEQSFLESVRDFEVVQEDLRSDENLRRFTSQLYPDLGLRAEGGQPRSDPKVAVPPEVVVQAEGIAGYADHLDALRKMDSESADHAELHLTCQMLQIMESAWLGLQLDKFHAHPLNRGWINVFHRWSSTPVVHRYWPLVRSEFSRGFVEFCERELNLGIKFHEVTAIKPSDVELRKLKDEFLSEWSDDDEDVTATTLDMMLKGIVPAATDKWLCWKFEISARKLPSMPKPEKFIIGMAIVSQINETDKAEYELLVWIRGGFRMVGIADNFVPTLLKDHIDPVLRVHKQASLVVRYPKDNWIGPGGRLKKKMWLTFFYAQGFRRQMNHPENDKYVVLRRNIPT